MHRIAHRPLGLLVATLFGSAWIAAQPVGGGGTAATRPPTLGESRLAQTWQAEAARSGRAMPGRAALLLSPFGLAPLQASDGIAAATAVTPAQALQIDEQLDGEVAWVQLGCCGTEDVEQARGVVHGVMAAKSLPADAPIFIEATTPALAASLAARLARDELTQVFVVEPTVEETR